jgi:hypothetical protein
LQGSNQVSLITITKDGGICAQGSVVKFKVIATTHPSRSRVRNTYFDPEYMYDEMNVFAVFV